MEERNIRLVSCVRVTRYATHVTPCDISCQRQPQPPLALAFVFIVLSPSASRSTFKNPSAFSLLFLTSYLQHCAFRYITWVALVCALVYPQGRTLTSLYRLALPLRSPHGCGITVHHGFLRASFASQFVKLIDYLL